MSSPSFAGGCTRLDRDSIERRAGYANSEKCPLLDLQPFDIRCCQNDMLIDDTDPDLEGNQSDGEDREEDARSEGYDMEQDDERGDGALSEGVHRSF